MARRRREDLDVEVILDELEALGLRMDQIERALCLTREALARAGGQMVSASRRMREKLEEEEE